MNRFIWLAEDPWIDIWAKINPVYSLNAFRFREDDGSETAATWLATENTNITGVDISSDAHLRVRIAAQETAGGAENNVDITLQYRVNTGTWTNVSGSTTYVTYITSTFVANGTATTDQLATPTGTFLPGTFVSVNASAARTSFLGNDHTEIEYSLNLLAADLAHGDVIEFRLLANGAAFTTYDYMPSATVAIPAPATAPVLSSTAKTDTTVDLSCTTVAGASTYEFQRDTVTQQNTASTTYNDTGLISATSYTYRVRGVNDSGPGPWSTELVVTTDLQVSSGAAATQTVNVSATASGVVTRSDVTSETINITTTASGTKSRTDIAAAQSISVSGPVVTADQNRPYGLQPENLTVQTAVTGFKDHLKSIVFDIDVLATATMTNTTRSGFAQDQNIDITVISIGTKSHSVPITVSVETLANAAGLAFYPPANLEATRENTSTILVSWDIVSAATSYLLERNTLVDTIWDSVVQFDTVNTQYQDTNAPEPSEFRYRVRAAIDL